MFDQMHINGPLESYRKWLRDHLTFQRHSLLWCLHTFSSVQGWFKWYDWISLQTLCSLWQAHQSEPRWHWRLDTGSIFHPCPTYIVYLFVSGVSPWEQNPKYSRTVGARILVYSSVFFYTHTPIHPPTHTPHTPPITLTFLIPDNTQVQPKHQ